MTGFELGLNAGVTQAEIPEWDSTYIGGHGTVHFDTTGACRAEAIE